MHFQPTPIAGAYLVETTAHADERGAFYRLWCADAFAEAGLDNHVEQTSLSVNPRRGTLRGMHWQARPHDEAKLVRCVAGAIHDCIIDLRPDSETYKQWFGVALSADNRVGLFIPPCVAHGFLTLADESTVLYQMNAPYVVGAARGVRWNDPAFGIRWPFEPAVISPRDSDYPNFQDGMAPAAMEAAL